MCLLRILGVFVAGAMVLGGGASVAQSDRPAREVLLSAPTVTQELVDAWLIELYELSPLVVETRIEGDPCCHFVVATTQSAEETSFGFQGPVSLSSRSPSERNEILTFFETGIGNSLALLELPSTIDWRSASPIVRTRASVSAMSDCGVDWCSQYPVAGTLIDDLGWVLTLNTPGGVATLSEQALAASDFSKDEAYALALANLARRARDLSWREEGDLRFAEFEGDDDSGLLLLSDLWAQLQLRSPGPIAAAIPTADVLAIGRADRPEDVERLRELIEAAALSPRVVSKDVFVRRDSAWAVLEP